MSARTPFFAAGGATPQQANQTNSSSSSVHDSFRPNGLLSSSMPHTSDASEDRTASQKLSDKVVRPEVDALSDMFGTNKPLNISNFAKKTSIQPNRLPSRTRKSIENTSTRTSSPKPFLSAQQAHRLTAPRPSSPFFAGSSGFVNMNSFRAPTLPAPSKLQSTTSAEEFGSNQAHIPNSETESTLYDGTDGQHVAEKQCQPTSENFMYSPPYGPALAQSRARTASHPSLEKIQESVEEEGLDDIGVRERLTADSEGSDSKHYTARLPQEGREEHYGQTLRRTVKRIQRPDEDEDETDYDNTTKRHKIDSASILSAPYSRMSSPVVLHVPQARMPPNAQPSLEYRPPSSAHSRGGEMQGAHQEQDGQGHALRSLLGQELDAYLRIHVEAYEEAKKKYSECSLDDWKAAAEEIAGKFAKMIDFVKDHMNSKLILYASLHSAVADHRAILSEREQTLKGARESLVRESGNVVGGHTSDGQKQGEREG
ncbi:uncharacterized protein LAESUDRAFT_815771 [Laetiporus sulphureus 93-53]|uniref:Extracellular mutant protein 11 C-terminal domain-containing protein n=1 Tax=Laetiporus sulphureus 93-53 TaxID=1314785 RepID=A0A165BT01_9APHY|nr:uncharacterized protein LAESUDRAFT_815771 [Laetiporus sulphureus 93-53]KZT01593.1 hypothetical protein LAESUDRAFT_815771 [Laetiporus sulphureus 93-53]